MAKKRSAKHLKRPKRPKPSKRSARKGSAKGKARPAKRVKGKAARRAIAKRPAKAPPAPRPVEAPASPTSQHDALVAGEQEVSAAKFAFAPPAELKVLDERERAQSIPWGYGRDKVVAMAIDPERLFIYWEVTDDAITRARAELGRSGDDSWLDLRVHDVTGLLFDGGNAHHFFDIGVARGDRQWFAQVGRPTSEVIVELGLLARDGRFAPIARARRVDFPRRDPAPAGPVEWLDVRPVVHGGGRPHLQANRAVTDGPGRAASNANGDGNHGGHGAGHDARQDEWNGARGAFWVAGAPWSSGTPADFVKSFGASSGSYWHEWVTASSHTLQWSGGASRWQWVGPLVVERWESGPIPVAVALPEVVEERFGGDVTFQSWRGLTRVQYGPWSVAIRGLRVHGGGRVIARWEVRKSWVVEEGVERFGIVAWSTTRASRRGALGGASEELGASEALFAGASERRMVAGSEVRLGGGSELFWLGASELNYGGGSALAFGGASERRMAGASEQQFAGASEQQFAGASERRLGGASESRLGGASEASPLPTLSAPSAP